MMAKEEMARQASEYYSNKDLWREELNRYKQILNDVVASMNSIIENANTRPARRKAEKQWAEWKENLQDLSVAENSPDQERVLREAIQRITRHHIARNPNGTVSNVEKVLEELRRREGIKNQE